ncbi:MAG TPA: PAS domain S-box protein, partial [Niastella sp.]|nr:PAS domain S-box protein [Niastella sp.]
MENAPLPGKENARLLALKEYHILDTPAEAELDDLTRLASLICNTPIALITLIDEHRQWFKTNIGLKQTETARNVSFCQHAILENGIYEIPNTTENAVFANNPMVTGNPAIRFYAGAPLINSDGYALGTLCVMDTVPRQLDDKQRETLMLLSNMVIQQFELARKKAEVEQTKQLYHKMVEDVADIIYTSDHNGNFTYVNQKVSTMLGYRPDELIGKSFTEMIVPEWRPRVVDFYS